MPPRDGMSVAHFLTVSDIERSLRFYEKVFGAPILSTGDPGYIRIANMWLIVNIGGGPTPDKPTVTLTVPPDPDKVSSFMNLRVGDIEACYKLWQSRGAEFVTEPKAKVGETRCYIRDPDGYLIEVGQTNPDVTHGYVGYSLPPRDGFIVAHFLCVDDVERSMRFYETVLGGRIVTRGNCDGLPAFVQLGNAWLILYFGGGPTPDKPTVTLAVPADPNTVSSFLNIRVADIQACYELWRDRGAEFITAPMDKAGETCCYLRDPDGHLIEVGQSKAGVAYG
jgi:predicted enzyme related to lactoylglutathione lyase